MSSETTSRNLEESWLIQRLEKPFGGFGAVKDNPFTFGGGLRNGGLSPEAMDLLRPIFSFAYMGAAEYEWGAVPKALNMIAEYAQAGELAAFETKQDVYILCPDRHRDEVERRVAGWLKNTGPKIRDPLNVESEYVLGWLELNNGFFFFKDEEMWRKTCELFGVEV